MQPRIDVAPRKLHLPQASVAQQKPRQGAERQAIAIGSCGFGECGGGVPLQVPATWKRCPGRDGCHESDPIAEFCPSTQTIDYSSRQSQLFSYQSATLPTSLSSLFF